MKLFISESNFLKVSLALSNAVVAISTPSTMSPINLVISPPKAFYPSGPIASQAY
jgi:hypothetical protein